MQNLTENGNFHVSVRSVVAEWAADVIPSLKFARGLKDKWFARLHQRVIFAPLGENIHGFLFDKKSKRDTS